MPSITEGTQDAQTTTQVVDRDIPDWYQDYTRNLAAAGANLAENLSTQPLPAQSVAGFTPDQLQAFQQTQQNQGAWTPLVQGAQTAAGNIAPTATQLVGNAQNAVSGPAQQWPSNIAQYMSPYTQGVVDEIARLGTRNFEENIMPGINNAMIGSGQFGSTRNADILSRAGRDAAADILGAQSQALQAGYTTSANIFDQDADRSLAQSGLQANTALQGASTAANALYGAATAQGNLATTYQALQGQDVNNLLTQGQMQQNLDQGGLNAAYQNALYAQQQPWTQLQNAQGLINGVQLPTTQIQMTNAPTGVYAPSAAAGLSTAFSYLNGAAPAPAPGPAPAPAPGPVTTLPYPTPAPIQAPAPAATWPSDQNHANKRGGLIRRRSAYRHGGLAHVF